MVVMGLVVLVPLVARVHAVEESRFPWSEFVVERINLKIITLDVKK